MFEPQPMKLPKRGKKVFFIFIIIFWIIVIIFLLLIFRQSKPNQNIKIVNDDLINVNENGTNQLPANNPGFDELLGPIKINDKTGNDQQTGNPSGNSGSIERLLEGKEIVVPEKENRK